MKHTTVLTDKDGHSLTIVFDNLAGVLLAKADIGTELKAGPGRLIEYATEAEARAAYDELNADLEAWHSRNDEPVMMPLDPPRPLSPSKDPADYRYEVLVDWRFAAHGTEHTRGAVIDYDESQSECWTKWIADGMIKRVPK